MLSLKQLEAFVKIVDLGTFELAAQSLNATQSTISKRISELEDATGVTLFDRSKRTARLTADGESLLQLAKDTLDSANQILLIKHLPEIQQRRVRIGFTDLTALTWLPAFFKQCSKRYPEIRLEIKIEMSETLYHLLDDKDLDIIVAPLSDSHTNGKSYSCVVLRNVEVAFIGRPENISSPKKVKLTELDQYNVLVQGRTSTYAQSIHKWLSSHGARLVPSMITDNLIALFGLISAGYGIGVLPKRFALNMSKNSGLVEIRTVPALPDVSYCAIYRDNSDKDIIDKLIQDMSQMADFTTPFIS